MKETRIEAACGMLFARRTAAILLLTVIASASVWKGYLRGVPSPYKVRVGVLGLSSLRRLDPSFISIALESNLSRALYSSLVEFSDDGTIVPGLARSWKLDGNRLIFSLRSNLQTSSGERLDPRAIAVSIFRAIMLGKMTHGNLSRFLRGTLPQNLPNLDPGNPITFEAEELTFHLLHPNHSRYVLRLLANPEYGIIPSTAVDWEDPEFSIKDRQNTSGRYFVSRIESGEKATWQLSAHHGHWDYSTSAPNYIEIIEGTTLQELISYLKSGRIDVIPKFVGLRPKDLSSICLSNSFNCRLTEPLKNYFVHFLPKGRDRLSRMERIRLALNIAEVLSNKGYIGPRKDGHLFLRGSAGALTEAQAAEFKATIDQAKRNKPAEVQNLTFTLARAMRTAAPELESALPGMKHKDVNKLPVFLPESEQPDFYIAWVDSGFFEDLSLSNYLLSVGVVDWTPPQIGDWLDRYVASTDDSARIHMIQNLHFQILTQSIFVPLASEPYASAARLPFEPESSTLFASSPLWKIRVKPAP